MKKYLPSLIFGLISLAAVAGLFIYLDRRPDRTVGDSESPEKVLKMELCDDGSYYIITGLGSYDSPDVVIPSEREGIPICEIGARAFWQNPDIASVTIPDTVTAIKEAAFRGTSISEITIPKSVKVIEGYVFADCERLETAVLPDDIDILGEHLFEGCSRLREVNIPKNITEIPAAMFQRCINLENIDMPDNIEIIGEEAFKVCDKLRSISLPEGLKHIRRSAFSGAKITRIDLPDSLETIGSHAFYGCPISEIDLPEGLREIGSFAFGRTDLESVYIPASVESMDLDGFDESSGSPFSRCKNLKNITISESNPVYYIKNNCIITRTGELLFALRPEDVPTNGSIKVIGHFAYSGIEADRIVVPEGVVEIKDNGISDYDCVREIILPSTLAKMGYNAISATGTKLESAERIGFEGTREQWAEMDRDPEWLMNRDKVLVIDLAG